MGNVPLGPTPAAQRIKTPSCSDNDLINVLYADAARGPLVGHLAPTDISVDPFPDARATYLSDHSAVEVNFNWELDLRPAVEQRVATGLQFEYFHLPRISVGPLRLPNFNSLEYHPKRVGVISTGRFLDLEHRDNRFAVRYTGFIDVPESGEYAFHLSSDDGSRLTIGPNDQVIVDNDGVHADREKIGYVALEAGLHPITLEYFQNNSGSELSMAWSGPGFERNSLLPSDFFAELRTPEPPRDTVPGLDYSYYHRSGELIPRFDTLSPVSTGRISGNDYLRHRDRDSRYGFRFDGYVLAPEDGLYTFQTRSDDGSRIYIGNQYLVNNDGDHGPRIREGQILLQKGYHPIRIDYIQNRGGQRLEINWDGPGVGGLRGIDASVYTFTDPEGVDFGDAPIDYHLGLDQQPGHEIIKGFTLGEFLDEDGRPLPSNEANRDDRFPSPDDEDGVTNPSGGALTISGGLRRGENNPLRIEVANDQDVPNPYVDAWIDFNQDGDWNDENEHVISASVVVGFNVMNVAVPESAEFGDTFARFRLHSARDAGLPPDSGIVGGEMEDHRVIVRADFAQTISLGDVVGSDTLQDDAYGSAVAIAGDVMVVGAPTAAHSGEVQAGAAYVYYRDGARWVEQAKLTSSDAASNDLFGSSVATDGETIVIGQPVGDSSGFAYVFSRRGTSWLEDQKLFGTDETGAAAGAARAVAVDGNYIVIGSYQDSDTEDRGSAYVFQKSGDEWSPQTRLAIPSETAKFGTSVSISADTIAVGAPLFKDGIGAAFVYNRIGASWLQQATFERPDGVSDDRFGHSISVHADTLVIGGYNVDNTGAADVFVRDGETWSHQAELQPRDLDTGGRFGVSVAVSGDGILVGAPTQDLDAGAAYLFRRDGTAWTLHEKMAAPDADIPGALGRNVALDGAIAAVGNAGGRVPPRETGAVHTYGIDSTSTHDPFGLGSFLSYGPLLDFRPLLFGVPLSISQDNVARAPGQAVQFGFELTPRIGTALPPLVELTDGGGEPVEPTEEIAASQKDKRSLIFADLPDDRYDVGFQTDKFDLRVFLVGDLNFDDKVDVEDGALLRERLGAVEGDNNYNETIDINRDGRIDATDYSRWRENVGASLLPEQQGRPSVAIDSTIDLAGVEVAPIGQANFRPIAAFTEKGERPSYFVENELVLTTDDSEELKELLERLNGTIVAEFHPAQFQIEELQSTYLIQVDPDKFDDRGLERDLFELQPDVHAEYVVSSDAGRRLLAAAAQQTRDGFDIGINWIATPSTFRDGATLEGPSPFGDDAFNWPHTQLGGNQDIGVAEAWRAMELGGVIDNEIRIAIIDRGFNITPDMPPFTVLPGSAPLGTPGWNWHGTKVTETAMAIADNGFGAAGTAAPVGHALLAHFGGDFFSHHEAVMQAYVAGAQIINMSFGTNVFLPWSIRSFNEVTETIRDRGVLLFAAAGNDGEDVDATIGRLGLVERRWNALV